MAKRKLKIIKLETVDSTNTYLKTLAEKGEREGCVVVARRQTSGRGRHGRSFFSPADTGLYMSVLLRPEVSVKEALFITGMTAVATASAIETVSNKKCGIKWVNDIFVEGKKVAGILCEGSFDHDADKVNYVIVGIGVNLCQPKEDFPIELREIATSLGDGSVRDALLEQILYRLFALYDELPSHDFLTEYKERSVLLGKRVKVLGNEGIEGVAIDIDGECRLILKTDSGETVSLSSGEVSVRLTQ